MSNNNKPKQQDISHEAVSLGRMVDRLDPGRYLIIMDIPRRDRLLGWDVECLELNNSKRVVLKRSLPTSNEPDERFG